MPRGQDTSHHYSPLHDLQYSLTLRDCGLAADTGHTTLTGLQVLIQVDLRKPFQGFLSLHCPVCPQPALSHLTLTSGIASRDLDFDSMAIIDFLRFKQT